MKIGPRPPKKTRVELVIDPPQVVVTCAECGGPMRLLRALDILTGEVRWLFWSCARYPACYCTHSAHPDGMPMGTPAKLATRDARHRAHLAFDLLWKRGGYLTRGAAYRWLTEMFQSAEQVHIGDMSLEQCANVERWARSKFIQLAQERKKTERSKKRAGLFRPNQTPMRDDRQYRADRHDQKQERQARTEPKSEPPKEPEEEPPDLGSAC